jgi:hypothetical protein
MVGIIGIIASLTVLGLSLVITRLATVFLNLTGLSWETAKFQARSAFTGTGFTTSEAETVVKHPVRRKVIMGLMIARSAGLVSIVISLILSFGSDGKDPDRLYRLLWLIIGVAGLWILARSEYVEQWMTRIMRKALRRWTDLEIYDYLELLKLSGEYMVRELKVGEKDWVVDKHLNQCRLNDEGVTVLGIYREDGSYVGAPIAETQIYSGDTLILYGREKAIKSIDKREAGVTGESAHKKAIKEEEQHKVKQKEKEKAYKEKKGKRQKRCKHRYL